MKTKIFTVIYDFVMDKRAFTAYDVTSELRKIDSSIKHYKVKEIVHDIALDVCREFNKTYTKTLLTGSNGINQINAFVYYDTDSDETYYESNSGYRFSLTYDNSKPQLQSSGTVSIQISGNLPKNKSQVTVSNKIDTSTEYTVKSQDRMYIRLKWLSKNNLVFKYYDVEVKPDCILVTGSNIRNSTNLLRQINGGLYISSKKTGYNYLRGDKYCLTVLSDTQFKIN